MSDNEEADEIEDIKLPILNVIGIISNNLLYRLKKIPLLTLSCYWEAIKKGLNIIDSDKHIDNSSVQRLNHTQHMAKHRVGSALLQTHETC